MTVQIEVLTSEQYEVEDSSGIVDLIEAIRIQASGPTEASRALRKKLSVCLLPLIESALTPSQQVWQSSPPIASPYDPRFPDPEYRRPLSAGICR